MAGLVSLDIETAPLYKRRKGQSKKQWRNQALLPRHSFITRIGAYFEDSNKYICTRTNKEHRKLLQHIADKGYEILAHNGKFDLVHIFHKYGIELTITHDPGAMAHALDNASSVGLEVLSVQWLGTVHWKGIDYGPSAEELLEGVEFCYKDLEKYLKSDVIETYKLYKVLKEQLKEEPEAYKLYSELYIPVIRAYIEIEKQGLYFNQDKINKVVADWQPKLDTLYKELMHRIHEVHRYPIKYKTYKTKEDKVLPFKINSSKQLGDLFYEYMDLPILSTTKSGNPGTDADTFKMLLALPDISKEAKKTLQVMRKYKDHEKLVKDFLRPLQRDNTPVASFKPYGTQTGRTACSNPNIQQIPRNKAVRSCLTSRDPESVFVEIDYSQVELRVAAFLSQDKEMCGVYRRGEDLHLRTAQVIGGTTEVTYESRTKAKAINFGLLYGMGAKSLAKSSTLGYGQYMTEEEAQEYKEGFYNTYEGYAEWLDDVVRNAKIDGYASSIIGRKRSLPNINSRNYYNASEDERKAVNTPIQSLASDILVSCLPKLVKLPNLKVVGTVHDAILFEIKKTHLKESLRTIVEIMENPPLFDIFDIDFNIPLIAEVDVGPWGKGQEYKKDIDF